MPVNVRALLRATAVLAGGGGVPRGGVGVGVGRGGGGGVGELFNQVELSAPEPGKKQLPIRVLVRMCPGSPGRLSPRQRHSRLRSPRAFTQQGPKVERQ